VNIITAHRLLVKETDHVTFSTIWESPAVGSNGPNFLNSASLFQTNLSLKAIKKQLISPIEMKLGRIRTEDKYMDRTIDLDVLVYDNQIIDPDIWSLAHLTVPASELMPTLKNTKTGKTLLETASELNAIEKIFQRNDLTAV
jgi:2-amino-4-hydroxy-6-hydroxymethyldihydropteridine diphosphokinase